MNFGQEMAKMKREERNKLYDRLLNATKKTSEKHCWNLTLSDTIIAAIQTINTLGMTAELRVNSDGKPILLAVKYEKA